ncbi:MAG: hypothetical protein KDI07_17750 [Anaerolineae bacterium]|nr:hypothetical protein [Anaerolineae bacterium]MCB0250424.1 hypothetical protein [Anaerolineae bacterium]HRX02531.1 hypothetical protein [Anaerolineae bacterium]
MRRANLQAGLFGGGMALLLDLIALLPYIGPVIAVPLYPLAFFLTGLIAVRITPYSPSVGEAASGGAVAGLVAAVIGGLGAMFLYPIRLKIAGGPEDLVRLLSPDTVQSLVERGINPVALMDIFGGVGLGIFCCSMQLTTGILLAALGASLLAAYRRT